MSFSPLPTPSTVGAGDSIWARRMISRPVPTTSSEVELNVLSLLLDTSSISSPPDSTSSYSPWSSSLPALRSAPLLSEQNYECDGMEMHAAHTAVRAALDVLEEPSLSRGLRISTSSSTLGLTGLSSPVSPAESSFSGNESEGGTKKKGRARMSQEKRKRLARRREREALVAELSLPSEGVQYARSAPSTPLYNAPGYFSSTNLGYSGFAGELGMPSPALTNASSIRTSSFGSIGTPSSSPTHFTESSLASSPPTLVIQPPSPQRIRKQQQQQQWNQFTPFPNSTNLASVF